MTKLVTAMKAARAALVGFFLSILAWHVSRRRSTPTEHTRNSVRSICASLLFAVFFHKMQKSSASLQEVTELLQVVQFYRGTERRPWRQPPGRAVQWWYTHPVPVKIYAERHTGPKIAEVTKCKELLLFLNLFHCCFRRLALLLPNTVNDNQWDPNLWAYTFRYFPCGSFAFGRPTGVK